MKFKALLAALAVLALPAAVPAQPPGATGISRPTRSAPMSPSSPTTCSRAARPGTAATTSPPATSPTQFEALGLQPRRRHGSWFQPVQLAPLPGRRHAAPDASAAGRFSHGRDFVLARQPRRRAAVDRGAPGLRRLRPRSAGARLRRLCRARRARQDRRRAQRPSGRHAERRRRASRLRQGADGRRARRRRPAHRSAPTRDASQPALGRASPAPRTGRGRPGSAPTAFRHDPGALRFNATVDRALAEALFAGAPRSLDAGACARLRARARGPRGFALDADGAASSATARAVTRFTSPNVIGLLPGTDPSVADEYVLLMAHLDGLGVRDPAPGDRPARTASATARWTMPAASRP